MSLREMVVKQNGQCFYCKVEMLVQPNGGFSKRAKKRHGPNHRYRIATKEHLHRRCEGGSNDSANLVAACMLCNSQRDWHSPLVWSNAKFRKRVAVYRNKRRKTWKLRRARVTKTKQFVVKRRLFQIIEKVDSVFTHCMLTLVSGPV
jgi:hypothetical protein